MAYNWFAEAMADYTIAMVVFILRIISRTRRVGFRGWQGDDYMVLCAMTFYTIHNSLFKAEYDGSKLKVGKTKLTPAQLDLVMLSLKSVYIGWFCFVTYIWSLKACMLFFYARLTEGLGRTRMVKIAAYLCGITYVGCILEVALHCLPPEKQWNIVKYPGNRGKICSTSLLNFAFVGMCNLLTDLFLLCIPIPLLWKVQKLPLKRKCIIGFFLCSGAFIVVASLCRNIYGIYAASFRKTTPQATVLGWAVRECLVAALVVNAPALKELVSSSKWLKPASSRAQSMPVNAPIIGLDGKPLVTVGSAGKKRPSMSVTGNSTIMTTMTTYTVDMEKDAAIVGATEARIQSIGEFER